jgi:hypothetical protein
VIACLQQLLSLTFSHFRYCLVCSSSRSMELSRNADSLSPQTHELTSITSSTVTIDHEKEIVQLPPDSFVNLNYSRRSYHARTHSITASTAIAGAAMYIRHNSIDAPPPLRHSPTMSEIPKLGGKAKLRRLSLLPSGTDSFIIDCCLRM